MLRRPHSLRLSTLLVWLSAVLACSSDDGGGGGSAGSTASHVGASGGAATGGSGASTGSFMDHGAVVALVVDPPSATIDVTNGVGAPASFSAIATYEDQTTAAVSASWSFDKLPLALVDSGGSVTANGDLGGVGTLTATVDSKTATASVTVKLHYEDNPAGVSPADQAQFDAPDGAPSGTLLYPYDKTVFARGLLPPFCNGTAASPATCIA